MSNQGKNNSKKQNSQRDRDKSRNLDAGGPSQSDASPVNDKDGASTHGKYAGISPESIQSIADQLLMDVAPDAILSLAEDTSYKIRQIINSIALHSEMMKKTQVDSNDVNAVMRLMDTSPIVGCNVSRYGVFGEEKLCFQTEYNVNVAECALTPQTYVFATTSSLSVEWITDEKTLGDNCNISGGLHNYYTRVARAILNLKWKLKEIAVEDLATNTRIGPIFPNLFNLAVLVLNDDNLNALNVPAKKPLQSNVLDMVDALCSNPCCLDTNIQQQFQRLFPVMVSNILGNGSLADKMVTVLMKITRTWPSFNIIGKGILFEYLAQGTIERLTAPMIKCVMALGRQALVECLSDHICHIDDIMHTSRKNHKYADLRETILAASTYLLRSECTTYLEDYIMTDGTLYDMLGDSIMPRRLLFPILDPKKDANTDEKMADDDTTVNTKSLTRPSKIKVVKYMRSIKVYRSASSVFEPCKFNSHRRLKIKIAGCRSVQPKSKRADATMMDAEEAYRSSNTVAVACGLLNRFRYRLRENTEFPLFGAYML